MTRSRKRRLTLLNSAFFLAGLVVFIDAIWIEPNWIQLTHYSVPAPIRDPLKIAHLTDLHSAGLGFRERRLLRLLEQEKPDVIVITGDTLSPWGNYEQAGQLLSRLHAPLGVWLVRGNWENWHILDNEASFYRQRGVSFLLNQSAQIRPDVWLMGFNDSIWGYVDLEKTLSGAPPGAYRIALFHSPVYFAESAGKYQLALAGHSHGGQVRIPFCKPLWLPRGVGPYLEGWFEQSGSRMYVSRGIGMSLVPVRFLCRPELDIITLQPVVK